MKLMKRSLSLLLMAVLLVGLCLPGLSNEAEAASAALVKKNGSWYYMSGGKVVNTTSLVKYNGAWWYVVNGKVASNTTSLVKYNGSWWYVVKGKVASNTTSLVKYNGSWWYVVKGKVASNTTSLVKYNNEWWYVVKGKIASNTTSLVKYNGSWYYVVKGKVASNTTTLVKYNGSWYYVNCGRVDNQSIAMCLYKGNWYYVNKGTVALKAYRNSSPSEAHYVYDEEGRLNYIHNGNGLVTCRVEYDSQGRIFREFFSEEDEDDPGYIFEYDVVYSYDAYGNYTRLYSFGSGFFIYYYTSDGLLQYTECYNQDEDLYRTDLYGYNSRGHLESYTSTSVYGTTLQENTKYDYNSKGQPVRSVTSIGGDYYSTTYYVYDQNGNCVQQLYCGTTASTINTFTYDYNGNLLSEASYWIPFVPTT